MHGIVEQAQPAWLLHILLGLRFGLSTLAVLAMWWNTTDLLTGLRKHNRSLPASTCIIRMTVPLGVLLFMPGGFFRLGVFEFGLSKLGFLQAAGLLTFCAYFIINEGVKHFQAGTSLKEVWLRVIPMLLATVVLVGIGAIIDVRP